MAGRESDAPSPLTAASLENAALHYLGRFASSAANLRRVLLRRVHRAAERLGSDPAEGAALVEALIRRLQQSGIIDDQRYAAAKAASLQRRGGSRRAISGRLAQQGVAREFIAAALEELTEGSAAADLIAACAFIRRRRLGAYRPADVHAAGRAEDVARKDLAALARAGFSFEVARKVLACRDAADVEALVGAAE